MTSAFPLLHPLGLLPGLAIALFVAAAVWCAVGGVRHILLRRELFDLPNDRSSHTVPTPRGGGLGLVPVLLAGMALAWLSVPAPAGLGQVLLAAAGLAAISFLDDLRGLGPAPRFLAQILAVALALSGLEGLVFQGLFPLSLDRFLAGLLWVWFVNLFNFMDGIDGITAVETLAIGLGVLLLSGLAPPAVDWIALLSVACALGFLLWNWYPARIFLGDVGSITLGFVTGWLLLQLAVGGAWAAAAILPAYYLADATTTLLRRLARRERIWKAHREHAYQRAVQKGLSHGAVSARIAGVNLVLLALATFLAAEAPWLALATAAVVVVVFLWHLSRRPDSLS